MLIYLVGALTAVSRSQVYVVLFFLWGHVQIVLAFFISAFFNKSRNALRTSNYKTNTWPYPSLMTYLCFDTFWCALFAVSAFVLVVIGTIINIAISTPAQTSHVGHRAGMILMLKRPSSVAPWRMTYSGPARHAGRAVGVLHMAAVCHVPRDCAVQPSQLHRRAAGAFFVPQVL